MSDDDTTALLAAAAELTDELARAVDRASARATFGSPVRTIAWAALSEERKAMLRHQPFATEDLFAVLTARGTLSISISYDADARTIRLSYALLPAQG